MRDDLASAIERHKSAFSIELNDAQISRLADYYELVQEHNPLLHLVAPCSAEEFATRHILESLTLLEFLPQNTRFADIGPGGGLPSIPCLLVREDLVARLIESKEKKAGFLQMVLAKCELNDRVELINRQFAEVESARVSYVTCRALDKFQLKLPQLIKWSGNCSLLFFGGPGLRSKLLEHGLTLQERLMPMSEQRFLFILKTRHT